MRNFKLISLCVIVMLSCLVKMAIAGYVNIYLDKRTLQISTDKESKLHFAEFTELATKYGYQSERHNITTEDGYNLQIFRIPASPSSLKVEGKPVVLLEHGLSGSSNIWALFNRSLAYTLADVGYDVWVGNCRGNYYGRSHITISPEEQRFWNFSFHEIGKLDYPATIDYILSVTKKSTLSLIGYSMGGTGEIILLSERPEYNVKVNVAVALAPAVFYANNTILKKFLKAFYSIKNFMDPAGMAELLSVHSNDIDVMDICIKYNISHLCSTVLEVQDLGQSDLVGMMPFENQLLAGTSTKCFWHFCQLSMSDQFRQYDYKQNNIEYYGQSNPPYYNISNITAKMIIIYANNDPICSNESAVEIARRIKDVTLDEVSYSNFQHHDFYMAKNLKTLVNEKIIKFISNYKE